jgi:hypothetical protein
MTSKLEALCRENFKKHDYLHDILQVDILSRCGVCIIYVVCMILTKFCL